MDVHLPDGTVIQNVPDGTTKADLVSKLQRNGMAVPSEWLAQSAPEQPASVGVGSSLNSIPRQLGLTARYALEGAGSVGDVIHEPIRAGVNWLGDKLGGRSITELVTGQRPQVAPKSLTQMAGGLADSIGLPSPEGANERVIGNATRLGFGAMSGAGAANAAAKTLTGLPQAVASSMAANPGQHAISAASAGGAAGASREAGGSPLMQTAAGVIGGLAAPMALGSAANAANKVKQFAVNKLTPQQYIDQAVNNKIELTLNRAGFDWSGVDERTRQAVRAEAAKALSSGQDLNADALRRLIDYKQLGVNPTLGGLTLDPVQITREKNLAKIGANSSDSSLHALAQNQAAQNARLIGVMNDAGAGRGGLQRAGETINSTVLGRQASLRGAEQSAWNEAKSSPGYTQPIAAAPISDINQALGAEGMMPFLNPTISKYMESFMTGQHPFTPQAYKNLQSMLSNEMSRGGNEAAAAALARRVLEGSQLRPVNNPKGIDFGNVPVTQDVANIFRSADARAPDAISAINAARGATRAAYAYEDSNPLVRNVLSAGASGDPMRVAKRFVIGGTPNEAEMLAQEVGPQGVGPIKDAIVSHLKEKALNGAADEVGKFSQSAYNKALRDIGERKLSLFFTPDEINQLRTVGRVSSYVQHQPIGSAVNNSNSGALMAGGLLDFLGNAGAKMPLGLKDTITGFVNANQAKRAMNPAKGLLVAPEAIPFSQRLAPSVLPLGLLAAP